MALYGIQDDEYDLEDTFGDLERSEVVNSLTDDMSEKKWLNSFNKELRYYFKEMAPNLNAQIVRLPRFISYSAKYMASALYVVKHGANPQNFTNFCSNNPSLEKNKLLRYIRFVEENFKNLN